MTKLFEGRRGKNVWHTLARLFRVSILGRLAGYKDINDAKRSRPRIWPDQKHAFIEE
jgi:hypothetical protein